jgi:regulator of sigma D
MIERDTLEFIPNIKSLSDSKIYYKQGIDKALENYCDTLIETLSDEHFIYPPTFKKREEMLKKYLYKLEIICKTAFYDKYREY